MAKTDIRSLMNWTPFRYEPVAARSQAAPQRRTLHALLALLAFLALVAAPSLLMADAILPPTLTMAFSPQTLSPGGVTTLTITIANPNPSTTLTGVGGFSVDLSPLKMTTLAGGGASGCVGTSGPQLTRAASSESSVITIEATLGFGSGNSCAMPFTIFLAADAALGLQDAESSNAITSDNGGTGNSAQASFTVVAPSAPHLTASVYASLIPQFATTFLKLTPVNPNNGVLTGVAFTDTLPAGLTIVGAGSSCSEGSIHTGTSTFNLVADAGTSLISVSEGVLYPTNPCYVLVQVEGIELGLQTITTSTITTTNAGEGDGATTSITVFDQLFEDGFEQP
jgi:hypothetical protein